MTKNRFPIKNLIFTIIECLLGAIAFIYLFLKSESIMDKILFIVFLIIIVFIIIWNIKKIFAYKYINSIENDVKEKDS